MRNLKLAMVPFVLSLFFTGCSTFKPINTSTVEGAYQLGLRYEKEDRFEEALAQFQTVKNKYPYSSYATLAQLKIADIYFEQENYPEAQGSYQVFKELHPTHPKSAYATYRLALSIYNQLPSTIDRDLSLADKAILYFDEVLQSYPESEYAAKAKDYKIKTLKMLAAKEYYIAHFYFIRDKYGSALGRFEELLQRYPDLGYNARALYGAAISAYKTKDLEKAKVYLGKLTENYKSSSEAKNAESELKGKL